MAAVLGGASLLKGDLAFTLVLVVSIVLILNQGMSGLDIGVYAIASEYATMQRCI